jgi:hypothetical protein
MYTKKEIIRPHDKYKELQKYIADGDRIYRKDVIKMGFNRIELTLYNYCKKNKLTLRKVNEEYWIKDYTVKRTSILQKNKKETTKTI